MNGSNLNRSMLRKSGYNRCVSVYIVIVCSRQVSLSGSGYISQEAWLALV